MCAAHEKFHFPAARQSSDEPNVQPEDEITLAYVKEKVAALLECGEEESVFRIGVVVLAPMIDDGGFSVEAVARATGYPAAEIEPSVKNLIDHGIWHEGGGWCCEWGEIFCGKDPDDMDLFRLQIAFSLDTAVAAGRVRRRQDESGAFIYQAIQ